MYNWLFDTRCHFLFSVKKNSKWKKKPNLKYLYMQRIITIHSFKILFETETTNIHSKFYPNELEMFGRFISRSKLLWKFLNIFVILNYLWHISTTVKWLTILLLWQTRRQANRMEALPIKAIITAEKIWNTIYTLYINT